MRELVMEKGGGVPVVVVVAAVFVLVYSFIGVQVLEQERAQALESPAPLASNL